MHLRISSFARGIFAQGNGPPTQNPRSVVVAIFATSFSMRRDFYGQPRVELTLCQIAVKKMPIV